jgi:glycosyltransferase involved in cell wall biosynthesis
MKFDIIIPTINRDSLNAAVESVYAQRHTNWRLFVIGDGVMPDLEGYNKDKVAVVSIDDATKDSGATQRNVGIRMGENPWIAYLDDDDVWYPDHLTTIIELHHEFREADMFKTAAQEMVMSRKSPRHKKDRIKLRCVNTDDPLTITIAHARDLFYKTSKWQSKDNHDHLLWKEMLAAGGVPAVSPNVTALFLR